MFERASRSPEVAVGWLKNGWHDNHNGILHKCKLFFIIFLNYEKDCLYYWRD